MDHNGWGGWPDDEPADTADLSADGSGFGDSDTGPGDPGGFFDYGDFGGDDLGGDDLGGADFGSGHHSGDLGGGDDLGGADFGGGHHVGGGVDQPLPDDTFGEADHPDAVDFAGDDGSSASAGFDGDPEHSAPDEVHGTSDGYADDAGAVEHLVGTDPDLDPGLDDPGWHDAGFPPPLGLEHVPEPVDGFPWSDPDLLGDAEVGQLSDVDGGWAVPPVGDLFSYAGLDLPAGDDAWAALLASDDPATVALARWWAPGG
jgi:hypothetical protein